jgi:hypothetical protein
VLALEIAGDSPSPDEPPASTLHERVRRAPDTAAAPLGLDDLRITCRVRKTTLCAALAELTRERVIVRKERGYTLASS